MRGTRFPVAVVSLVLTGLAIAPATEGQEIPAGYEVGLHIVRQGDTLRSITRAYLGSESLWEKNWALNPQVVDPDRLFPMQRLRVLLAPQVARPTAKVTTISGTVEGKPAPADWSPSAQDDLMIERDGIRAAADSSTVLEFNDGSELTIVDDSTVFLRVAGRSLRGVEQRAVEVVRGQADLQAAAFDAGTEIEVIVGGTVAKPRVGSDGRIETRARRSSAGGTELMVFEGESEVEAGGAKVAVARGMGTAVPKSGPPAPPEKLLPTPAELAPAASGEYELGRDSFTWSDVAGAASYSLEICRDAACGELALRRTGIGESLWDAAGEVEVGDYFWRVMAVSPSGLDGYASSPRAVRFVPLVVDTEPPTGSLSLAGASVTRRGTTYWAPAVEVELTVADEMSEVASVAVTVNGEEVPTSRLAAAWPTGEYEVEAVAVDGAGNEGVIGPLAFAVDADPPAVEPRVGGLELLGVDDDRRRARAAVQPRWVRRRLADFDAGREGPLWRVVRWSAVERPTLRNFVPNLLERRPQIDSLWLPREEVQLVLFAPALVPAAGDPALGMRFLLLAASDERSGMTDLRLSRVGSGDASSALEIDVVDRLENRQVVRFDFARRPLE